MKRPTLLPKEPFSKKSLRSPETLLISVVYQVRKRLKNPEMADTEAPDQHSEPGARCANDAS